MLIILQICLMMTIKFLIDSLVAYFLQNCSRFVCPSACSTVWFSGFYSTKGLLIFLKGATKCHRSTHSSCVASTHPMYPELYKCNSRESTFVEFCVDGINLFVENNFIDSLGPGRDSNPHPQALQPSECNTTPSTSYQCQLKRNLSQITKRRQKIQILNNLLKYDTVI